jgi:hypothetical protein
MHEEVFGHVDFEVGVGVVRLVKSPVHLVRGD